MIVNKLFKIKHLDRLLSCIILSFIFLIDSNASSPKISVIGSSRIPSETVLMYAKITDIEDQKQWTNAIKNLYDTSFFRDVQIEKNGNTLIIKVKENPVIRKVVFEGNKAVNDETLKKAIKVKSKDVYTATQIYKDSVIIQNVYNKQGYYNVKVDPQVIELPDNKVDLIYEVKQGEKAKIKRINFVGNKVIKNAELKESIMSREFAFYRFFSSADMYDPDKITMDQELLKRLYQKRGYFDFNIKTTTAELTPSKDGFIITFLIEEGSQYKVSDFDIVSKISDFPKDKLKKLINISRGAVVNIDQIEDTENAITKYLGSHGYAFAEVTHQLLKNHENGEAIIRFMALEGPKFYINKININNNIRTMDKVIRRKMKIEEGDHYSNTLLEKSKRAIQDLGFFSVVDFKNKKTEHEDKIDIEIDVKEKGTGSMNLAVGYNPESGFMGSVSLTENNFVGSGRGVELAVSKATQFSQMSFGITESHFMGQPLDAGFDLYGSISNDKFYKYSAKEIGSGIRLKYEVSENIHHGLRYGIKRSNISQSGDQQSITAQDSQGIFYNSSIGHTLYFSQLDSLVKPSKGFHMELSHDFSGVGGDVKYIKNQAAVHFFIPLYKNDVVFRISTRAGSIGRINGQRIRLIDNYHISQDYLRGFEPSGISPRDSKTGNAIGAKNYCTGTMEIIFPLGLPDELGIEGVTFIDAATTFGYDLNPEIKDPKILESSNIRSSYGVGIIWKTPFGKIKVGYGIPIRKEKFDNVQRAYFSIGGIF